MNITKRRQRIKKRVRDNLIGTGERPRISIFRSNKYIYAQAIDDQNAITLASIASLLTKSSEKITKTQGSQKAGEVFADTLKKKQITKAVFDRGWHAYKGRVKVFAETLRANGIEI